MALDLERLREAARRVCPPTLPPGKSLDLDRLREAARRGEGVQIAAEPLNRLGVRAAPKGNGLVRLSLAIGFCFFLWVILSSKQEDSPPRARAEPVVAIVPPTALEVPSSNSRAEDIGASANAKVRAPIATIPARIERLPPPQNVAATPSEGTREAIAVVEIRPTEAFVIVNCGNSTLEFERLICTDKMLVEQGKRIVTLLERRGLEEARMKFERFGRKLASCEGKFKICVEMAYDSFENELQH